MAIPRAHLMTWRALAESDPDLAAAGRRLFERDDGIPIALIATVSARGAPRLAPVCPIFCDGNLYLSVGDHTPKVRDLRASRRFVLHAFLGHENEEFQISGRAVLVTAANERARVHASIRFPVFNAADPVFRLEIATAVWSRWDGPAERPSHRRRWRRR